MNPVKRRKIAKRKVYFEKLKKVFQEPKLVESAKQTIAVVEKVVQEEVLSNENVTLPVLTPEVSTVVEPALELIEDDKKEADASKKKKKN